MMGERELNTRLGPIRGIERKGAVSFLGVRYAEPPPRFRPAQQAGRWLGTYDATQPAAQAMQQVLEPASNPLQGWWRNVGGYSEDCLFLNIHVPATPSPELRPVMVWIHGGGFVAGSANQYDGTMLAVRADTVVVCINYRLGIWGSLDLRAAGAGFEEANNVWFSDQFVALSWIRDNIADFGGDPGNVTVMGQSAGGTSVLALVASPRSRGLLHKAVANSPAFAWPEQINYVERVARSKRLSLKTTIDFLLTCDAAELVKLNAKGSYYPCIDGSVLTGSFVEAIRNNRSHPIPLITGMARRDGDFLGHLFKARGRWSILLRLIAASVATLPAGAVRERKAYLSRLKTTKRPRGSHDISSLVWTDIHRKSSLVHAEANAAAGGDAWHYVFDVPCRFNGAVVPSTHCVDLPFTFDWFEDSDVAMGDWVEATDSNKELAVAWIDALSRFSRTGSPEGSALGRWPRYDEQRLSRIVAGDFGRVEPDIDSEYRTRIWNAPLD